ncbi:MULTISPECIES: hypothetical protein [Rhodopseudomonas]|uniref:hypothetical protein n=1 Tax=Rhodopseudomonas TaxID=1073 RepID=UPI00128C5736|nr:MULTISPECIES: hypothetical protein [Rhodopseudomonas]MDF3812598.1 hypothetical protein [Rhodopseudomonas sp. BAL398]WOK17701.1 hypothetical protein RBJ75_26910 [Rhodopseudomonas sp. BAL398]
MTTRPPPALQQCCDFADKRADVFVWSKAELLRPRLRVAQSHPEGQNPLLLSSVTVSARETTDLTVVKSRSPD